LRRIAKRDVAAMRARNVARDRQAETAAAIPSGSARIRGAVVTAANADVVARRALAAGVPIRRFGATGGGVIAVVGERPLRIEDLARPFASWLPTTWPDRADAIAD